MAGCCRSPLAVTQGGIGFHIITTAPALLHSPAGYKEKNRTTTTYDRAEIVPCGKGEVSFWTGAVRTPASKPEECQACIGDNTYAQRIGACVRWGAQRGQALVGSMHLPRQRTRHTVLANALRLSDTTKLSASRPAPSCLQA